MYPWLRRTKQDDRIPNELTVARRHDRGTLENAFGESWGSSFSLPHPSL